MSSARFPVTLRCMGTLSDEEPDTGGTTAGTPRGPSDNARLSWRAMCLFSVLLALAVPARQLYVATNGSDETGSGGWDTPVATLAGALELAEAHDTITFRAGSYAGHNMIRIPHLTLRSNPGEAVHITNPYGTGQDVVLRFWSQAHHGVIENLEISGGDYYTVMFYSDWENGPDRAHSGRISGCNLHHSGYDVIKITPECDNVIIENCEIHHSGRYFLEHDPDSFHVGNRNDPAAGINYFSLGEWQSLPLHRGGSGDQHSQYGNPLLDSAGAPHPTSSCRGTGMAIAGLYDDFYGHARGDTIDIGAIQVSGVNLASSGTATGLRATSRSCCIYVRSRSLRITTRPGGAGSADYAILDLRGRTVRRGRCVFSRASGSGASTANVRIELPSGRYIFELRRDGVPTEATAFVVTMGNRTAGHG